MKRDIDLRNEGTLKDFSVLSFGGEDEVTYRIFSTQLKAFTTKVLGYSKLNMSSSYLPMPIEVMIYDKRNKVVHTMKITMKGCSYTD
ncbi:MAG: hypothetical protein K5790_10270 [Nitrosopumilus sp.]|uniref:hypothetical protein n=1 Tax=Nitrosopumilus sp. TaxID=2024843 RepID=UPI00247E90E2|nr:hypothetical protein [Nitrosopumilus sp.]MCV0393654.1 hypothetical protein [Nitrosopumilus sp.]